VITKPLITKKISTPMIPPGVTCGRVWAPKTSSAEIALSPSMPLIRFMMAE
jgi:hypothetical protein